MDYSNLRSKFQKTAWAPAQEDILLEPYTYISANPGKEIRSKMIEAFDIWLKVPQEDLDSIKAIVRMLHNASLLMDDVEDNSELRRGLPVAHTVYGVPQTINTANYVYFLAVQQLLKLETLGTADGINGDGGSKQGKGKGKASAIDLVAVVNDELLQLHRGQGLDLFWRDSLQCPTEEEYVEMVLGKTGGLFRIAVKLMMARSDNDVDYVPLVNLISVFFQIRDDYMNLQSAEYADNKGFAEDLSEGKFSFPVVHGIRADGSNRQILNVLQKRTNSHSLKTYIVNHLRHSTKSFAYTRQVLQQIKAQLVDEVESLGGNPMLEAILKKLDVPKESDDEVEAHHPPNETPVLESIAMLKGKLNGLVNGNGNGVH